MPYSTKGFMHDSFSLDEMVSRYSGNPDVSGDSDIDLNISGDTVDNNTLNISDASKNENKNKVKLSGLDGRSYYRTFVPHPQSGDPPYFVECTDIIDALDLDFFEGELFKALWRKAQFKKGKGKPGNSELYEAEKIAFYGPKVYQRTKRKNKEE